jgi:hypothetical protein
MTTHRYKNITDQELVLVGFGVLAVGETIETEEVIENPNLETLNDAKTKKSKLNKEDGDGERT